MHATLFEPVSVTNIRTAKAAADLQLLGVTRRLAKCATVSVPTHSAILPCSCVRSVTTKTGCCASSRNRLAFLPWTSMRILIVRRSCRAVASEVSGKGSPP